MKTAKQVLSGLLILSAILGLAGGARTIRDVMDCRIYWEDRYEEAVDNLGKLSDGLSQLQENETAYLEGRESYEKGQSDLAAGQKAYDEGSALLEEKQAEYEAGKKKLADAETQLAEGKAKLDANKAAYEAGLVEYEAGKAKLAVGKQELDAGKRQLDDAKVRLDEGKAKLDALTPEQMTQMEDVYYRVEAAGGGETGVRAVAEAATWSKIEENNAAIQDGVTAAVREVVRETVLTDYASEIDSAVEIARPLVESDVSDSIRSQITEQVVDQYSENIRQQVLSMNPNASEAELALAVSTGLLFSGMDISNDVSNEMANHTDEIQAEVGAQLEEYRGELVETFTDIAMLTPDAQDAITENVANTKQNLFDQNIDGATAQVRQAYEGWQGKMAYDEGVIQYEEGLAKYEAGLAEYRAGEQQLAEGRAKLDEYETGLATYNSGLAEYNAGKKKLEEGAVQLADGRAKLEDAEKQLADGKQQLADGASQLAQFEDGREQVLAGLDTLLSTKADADLESIASRLGSGFTVTEGEAGLDFDKGQDAVDAGLAYTDDNVAAVTKELTTRLVGAVLALIGGLAAAVSGILGLCGKSKAAGILGVCAAVAAGVGLLVSLSTNNVFSKIAGSTGSSLLLTGAVAMVVLGAAQFAQTLRAGKAAAAAVES